MTAWVVSLYVVAFALQMIGAGGVIWDAWVGRRNMRTFKTALDAAERAKDEQRQGNAAQTH